MRTGRIDVLMEFSPHTRGCSVENQHFCVFSMVFPAYAGMFLAEAVTTMEGWSFPRIRGDVPTHTEWVPLVTWFSPHTRGCSCLILSCLVGGMVFPAYAGMFLSVPP